MAIKPVLFNTDMVRAILEGRKTVTRRILKPQPEEVYHDIAVDIRQMPDGYHKGEFHFYREEPPLDRQTGRPWGYGLIQPFHAGDVLWVRETWFYERHMEDIQEGQPDLPSGRYSFRYVYRADSPAHPVYTGVYAGGWRPSIHMPKEAARLFLRVADVRAERLQEITMAEIKREGEVPSCAMCSFNEELNNHGINCQKGIARSIDCPQENAFPDVGFRTLWDRTIKQKDREKYGWAANPWVWVISFERCEKPEGW